MFVQSFRCQVRLELNCNTPAESENTLAKVGGSSDMSMMSALDLSELSAEASNQDATEVLGWTTEQIDRNVS